MKRFLTVLFILSVVSISQAQWVVQNFDNAVGPFFLDPPELNVNWFTNGTGSFMNLSNDPDHYEGTGSMKVDYSIEGAEGWGGYGVRSTYVPGNTDALPYLDFSSGTHLSLWYKVTNPTTFSQDGTFFMEFKLAEINAAGERDLWLHHTAVDFSDVSGGWINVLMPLQKSDDNTQGFVLQFGDGDQELQLDKIKGFEMAFVYLTAGGGTPPPTASGSVLFDRLEVVGNRYTPLHTFDDTPSDFFVVDPFTGSATLSNNNSDYVEGTGSMELDYTVNCSESWGGYINMQRNLVAPPDSFGNRTALDIFIKNLTPHVGTNDRLTMRFFIIENNTGTNEDWVCEIPIDLDQASEWTRYYMPLDTGLIWTDPDGHQHFPNDGFAQPWWNPQGDQQFNPTSIVAWKIELSGGGNEYGTQGEQLSGTLLFDVLQQSGFQFDDHEPPPAPQSIAVFPGTNTNLVTWADVPRESGEHYDVYASNNPITDITAPGVDLIASNILEDTQVYEHLLLSPKVNESVTFYYAIVCTDFAGNVGEPGFSGGTTNDAYGIAVLSFNTPNFVADGDLGEWAGIQEFKMYAGDTDPFGHPQYTIDNDDDCSASAWLAIDQEYLYVAFDVDDDVFFPVNPDLGSWELDAPDLFLGLYNWQGSMHQSYQRGNNPDYHLRFNEQLARNDDGTASYDSLLVEGENYYFGEKFPSGYVVEARILLSDLATKRNDPNAETDRIYVTQGMRVPVDFGVNDNDGDPVAKREGIMFYSSTNQDVGWQHPNKWSYTWAEDWVLDAGNDGQVVTNYSLSQNYPNPFNPTTQIHYSIEKSGNVSLKVYDVLGRQVAELVNTNQAPGQYTVNFNGESFASGVYLFKIESGSFTETKKMILMK